jgi:hypothetical protein
MQGVIIPGMGFNLCRYLFLGPATHHYDLEELFSVIQEYSVSLIVGDLFGFGKFPFLFIQS